MKKFANKNGMTFMELIVYLGVFSITILTLIRFYVSVTEWQTKAQGYIEIENAFTYINRSFKDTFKKAITIDDLNSVYDSSNGKVVINSPGESVSYYLSGNKLIVNRLSGGANDLTDNTTRVTNFRVEKIIDKDGVTVGVRITIDYHSSKYPSLIRNITTSFLI